MNDREFWVQVRRGLLTVVAAIDYRWGLPRSGSSPLNAAASPFEATLQPEPPRAAFARSSKEGIESDGI
jgi:hypothetical protein